MIQRIQSIWLLLATITICSFLFVPIFTTTVGNNDYQFLISGLYQKTGADVVKTESFLPLFISAIIVAVLCFLNIFNFRNRPVQKRVIMLTILLVIGVSIWCFFYLDKINGKLDVDNFSVGAYLPLLTILFLLLAVKGINKDEKLIRSVDRLR